MIFLSYLMACCSLLFCGSIAQVELAVEPLISLLDNLEPFRLSLKRVVME